MSRPLVLPAVLPALLCVACAQDPEGGESPRDAMERFLTAFSHNNLPAAQKLILGSPAELDALRAMMRFVREGRVFRDKMIQAYGEAGWTSFNDKADAQLRLASPADIDLSKAEIKVTGPVAHIRIEKAGVTRLERRRGRWFLPLKQWMDGDVGAAARRFDATTQCVLEFGERIGKPGETADSIDAAMAPALVLASRTR